MENKFKFVDKLKETIEFNSYMNSLTPLNDLR
jgi:hypothetical protein